MLALTACGDSADDDDSSRSGGKSSSDSSVSQTDKDGSDGDTDSDTDTDSGKTPDSEDGGEAPEEEKVSPEEQARADFYKQLDEEYQKYGMSYYQNSYDSEFETGDPIFLGKSYGYFHGNNKAYIYNEDGGYADVSQYGNGGTDFTYITGDKIYSHDGNCNLDEIDMQGNKTRSFSNVGEMLGATVRGDLLFKKDEGVYFCGEGEVVLRDISTLPADVGHGMTDGFELKSDDISYIGSYANKIYLEIDGGGINYYYLDCDALELHKVDIKKGSARYCVGKYMFRTTDHDGNKKEFGHDDDASYEVYPYDMETDTYVEGMSMFGPYMIFYRGGDTVNVKDVNNSHLVELKLPGFEGSETTDFSVPKDGYTGYEKVKEYDDAISSDFKYDSIVLSKIHYAVMDKYGIFIHSFENGAADEIKVVTFN